MKTAAVALLSVLCVAQERQEPIRSTSQEVLLDLIVRDKGQRLVRDLRPDEVAVYEDGVRQEVRGFRYVEGRAVEGSPEAGTPAQTAPGLPFDPLREINLVTLVFEAMDRDARRLADQVANEFLDHGLHSNTYVAVFTLNNRLALLQPYTRDLALIRRAVVEAGKGNYQDLMRKSMEKIVAMRQFTSSLNSLPFSDAGQNPLANVPGGGNPGYHPLRHGSAEDAGFRAGQMNIAEYKATQMMLQIMTHQVGSMAIDAIRNLIRGQAELPGRKTILYLSDGLVLPPGLPELLRSAISEANRANVAFYTVHTVGLDTASQMRIGIEGGSAISSVSSPMGGEIEPGNPMTVRGDWQNNLIELAEATGGFAMVNSNDLRKPVRRLMEDVRAHYELTYTPTSTNYDGHFRRIEVRINRKGLTAQTREGYFALPAFGTRSITPAEWAVLRAMDTNPVPRAFPFRSAALRLRPTPLGIGHAVVFEIPSATLQLKTDEKSKTFHVHVSMLGLIRNAGGQVVEKVSRDFAWGAGLDKAEEFRKGNVIVKLPLELPPGRYTLETGVIDRVAVAASVRKSVLAVAPPEALPATDLVLVRRIEPPDEQRDPLDPLEFEAGKVTPNLSGTAPGAVPLYLVAWPRNGGKATCTVQIRRDGAVVGTMQADVPAPDRYGASPVLVDVPPGTLTKGQHEIAVLLRQGEATTGRMLVVNVE